MDHVTHSGPHQQPPDLGNTMGNHGMLLFGGARLYLSHLPMFHHPHNFQVLLAVDPDDAARAALDAHPSDMYTFDPEPFPIAELGDTSGGPRRTSLRGTLFRGHFERGGRPIAKDTTMAISRVVHFRELQLGPGPGEPGELSYLCFGEPGRLFLAHEIVGRPSFDQVLEVSLVPGTVTTLAGSPVEADVTQAGFPFAQPARIRRTDGSSARLAPGETVPALFAATAGLGLHGFGVHLRVGGQLYLEVDELR